MLRIISSLILTFAFSAHAFDTKKQLVEEVLQASSIKISLAQIPAQMAQLPAMLPPAKDQSPQEHQTFAKDLTQSIFTRFNEVKAYEAVTDHFYRHADEVKLTAIRDWLISPTGRMFTNLELSKQTGDISGLQNYMQHFDAKQLSPERATILLSFIESMNLNSKVLDSLERLMPIMMQAISKQKGESNEAFAIALESWNNFFSTEFQSIMEKMEPQMQQQLLASLSYYYEDVSDHDLDAYSNFLQSDAGQHYIALSMDSAMDYMTEWMHELIPELMEQVL